MNNNEKLMECFASSLGIDKKQISDNLLYNSIAQWDSIAHMVLIAALENSFEIMLDTDDIVDMSSVAKAKEILSKYNISF